MNWARSAAGNVNWALPGFTLALVLPSTALAQKYTGILGAGVYAAFAGCLLVICHRHRSEIAKPLRKVDERSAALLALATLLVLAAAFSLVYPIADSGVVGGGSDGDNALDVAARELLHLRYPYYPSTNLGNPLSPLPGAVLLAVPFVLLSSSGWQSFLWLAVFLAVVRRELKTWRKALFLFWTIFLVSPITWYFVLIGNDYTANCLYVLSSSIWLRDSVPKSRVCTWQSFASALFLGVCLSSRANFLLLLPLVYSLLIQKTSVRNALVHLLGVLAGFCSITLPVFICDPSRFSPLHTAGKLGQFGDVLPYAGIIIPFFGFVLALICAWKMRGSKDGSAFYRCCFYVLAFPVACGVVLGPIKSHAVNLSFAAFGVFPLFFGALGFSPFLNRPDPRLLATGEHEPRAVKTRVGGSE